VPRRANHRDTRAGGQAALWPAVGWFALVAGAVLGPLARPGYLLLLDAPAGPDAPWPSWAPLPSEGLVNATVPFDTLVRILGQLSPQAPNKLLIAGVILVGGIGLFRSATRCLGASPGPALLGATLFVVNPFVYERLLAGQLSFAFGCALLPWALPSLGRVVTGGRSGDVLRSVLWIAAASAVSVHVGGMVLVLVLAAVAASPRRLGDRSRMAALTVLVAAGLSLYWALPSTLASEQTRLGAGDLAAFAPRPRSPEILPRALLLHGFWRNEFTTPLRNDPLLFLASFLPILGLAAGGFFARLSSRRWRRGTIALSLAAAWGLLLGMGTSFPATAGLTRFLFQRLPGYGIYREPQKWLALVMLFYAVLSILGLQGLIERLRARRLRVAALSSVLLVFAATPTMLWGFAGQAGLTTFPRDWAVGDRIASASKGALLFLPWNLYEPLPFAGNRIIGNPGEHYFSVPTLSSNDPRLGARDPTLQADPRDRYVSALMDSARHPVHLGHLVAPLDIRHVALAHVANASDYGWLYRQDDLVKVFDGPDLTLFENLAWRGPAYSLRAPGRDLSTRELLGHPQLQLRAGRVLDTEASAAIGGLKGPAFMRSLPFWQEIDAPPSRVTGTARSCADGWRLGSKRPLCHLGAVAAFVSSGDRTLWRPGLFVQIMGYTGSLATAAALLVLSRRDRSTHDRGRRRRILRR
jgi:hypothetical protein